MITQLTNQANWFSDETKTTCNSHVSWSTTSRPKSDKKLETKEGHKKLFLRNGWSCWSLQLLSLAYNPKETLIGRVSVILDGGEYAEDEADQNRQEPEISNQSFSKHFNSITNLESDFIILLGIYLWNIWIQ